MSSPASNGPAAWLTEVINDFIRTSPENSLKAAVDEPAWGEALLGFASGADPIWQQYKEYVGPFHWTPWEIFSQTHPQERVSPEELTVISWVLPQREAVRADNREEKVYPAERWARVRLYGEKFNELLRSHVAAKLAAAGHPAVVPVLSPLWSRLKSQRFNFASTWSERHAAHAAGLGTFGLCDGLITARGKAHRLGSVVARLEIEPTPRPYQDHHAYCLFYAKNTCGDCIDRCPAGAISEAGHDKDKCYAHLLKTRKYVPENYNFPGYGCGLCQVGVPCESTNPMAEGSPGQNLADGRGPGGL